MSGKTKFSFDYNDYKLAWNQPREYQEFYLLNSKTGLLDPLKDSDAGDLNLQVEAALKEASSSADAILEKTLAEAARVSAEALDDARRNGWRYAQNHIVISRNMAGANFARCLTRVRKANPKLFGELSSVFEKRGLGDITRCSAEEGAAPTVPRTTVLAMVFLHRMCSEKTWEREFMRPGVAASYIDLGCWGAPDSDVRMRGITLASLAAWYGIPLPNAELLTLPAFLSTPYFTKTPLSVKGALDYYSSVASIYLTLFAGTGNPCYEAFAREFLPQMFRLSEAVKSISRGEPDRLARMLASPGFLMLPDRVRADVEGSPLPVTFSSRTEPMAKILFSSLRSGLVAYFDSWGAPAKPTDERPVFQPCESFEENIRRREACGFSTTGGTMRSLLESGDTSVIEGYPQSLRHKDGTLSRLRGLAAICSHAWKSREKTDWLGLPVKYGAEVGHRNRVPFFSLLFHCSPTVPELLDRDEWDPYLRQNGDYGSCLMTEKRWKCRRGGSGMENNRMWVDQPDPNLIRSHFREDDFFITGSVGKTFFDANVTEVLANIRLDMLMSMQAKSDTERLVRWMRASSGMLISSLEDPKDPDVVDWWRRTGRSPLRDLVDRLHTDPPRMRDDEMPGELRGFIEGFSDLFRYADRNRRALGLSPGEPSVARCTDADMRFMTRPLVFWNGKGKNSLSIFDILLRYVSLNIAESRYHNSSAPTPLVRALLRSPAYWDIPVDEEIHGPKVKRPSVNERRLLDIPYCVFDRLLEILVKVALDIGVIDRWGKRISRSGPSVLDRSDEEAFIKSLAERGQRYVDTATNVLYATSARKSASDLLLPRYRERFKVCEAAGAEPEDFFDDYGLDGPGM